MSVHRGVLHWLQVPSRGLSLGQTVPSAAVGGQAGQRVASRVGQGTRLVASSVAGAAVRVPFVRTGRRLPVGGA